MEEKEAEKENMHCNISQRGFVDNFVDEILERFVAYLKPDTSYLTGQVVKAKLNTSLYMKNGLVMSFRKREQQCILMRT